MLCRNSYPQDYIDECRASMESQLAAYGALVAAAHAKSGPALEAFEPLFLNNLVIVLDGYFVHRARTMEGKDGNVLNEFRMICTSILENGGVMSTSKTNNKSIRYDPAKSVLGLEVGKPIRLTEAKFVALFGAFLAEIENRFASSGRRAKTG